MKSKILLLVAAFLLAGVNLYAAGDLQVNGNLGIGTPPDADFKVSIATTDVRGMRNYATALAETTSVMEAANFAVHVDGLADYGIYYGLSNRVVHIGQNPNILRMNGSGNSLQLNSTNAGTTSVLIAEALSARISNSNTFARDYDFTSSANGLVGIGIRYNFATTSGGGTVTATDIKGIDIDAPSGTPLSVSNSTGIWIDQHSAGTTSNNGIVLDGDGAGADVSFGYFSDGSYSGRPGIYSINGYLYATDYSGNKTQISPHDPDTGEWIFYSKNINTGKVVRVNMEKLVKAVEKLTGEKFMIETIEK